MKEADAEEVVKKWLKAASDRQGGRQRRLEKKARYAIFNLARQGYCNHCLSVYIYLCVCVFPCVRVEVIHDTL